MTSGIAARLVAAGSFLAVALAPSGPARAESPAAAASTAAPAAPIDVDRTLAPLLGAGSKAERLAAAQALEKAGPSQSEALATKLADLAKAKTPGVPAAMEQARKAAGRDGDLLEALCGLEDGPAVRTAAASVALARALAAAGTIPGARALVKLAGEHQGALRPELVRLLRKMGDRALPALIETRKDAPPLVRQWAYAQLEGMGKRIPGDAVQTKDNEVLTAVLQAYARIGDLDALPVILSFVNADRVQVRTAAREAVVSYGPEAIWKLREAYANVANKPAPEGASAEVVAKELFAAYDRLRLQEVYGLFDEGLAAAKEGRLEAATAAFDRVLARQPLLDRRAEAVPGYLAHGRKLAETDGAAARPVLEKALRLAPEGPYAPQIQAELAYLEGKDLLARGIADDGAFRRALEKDPTHTKARAELERMSEVANERDQRLRAWSGAGAVLLVGVLAAILFGGFRRRGARAAG